jgi:hypothetical protein
LKERQLRMRTTVPRHVQQIKNVRHFVNKKSAIQVLEII